jgi:hypothetical protein
MYTISEHTGKSQNIRLGCPVNTDKIAKLNVRKPQRLHTVMKAAQMPPDLPKPAEFSNIPVLSQPPICLVS